MRIEPGLIAIRSDVLLGADADRARSGDGAIGRAAEELRERTEELRARDVRAVDGAAGQQTLERIRRRCR